MSHGPLVALHTIHHSPHGIVPADLLVEAAADVGYRTLALTDFNTLRSAPSFLKACRQRGVHPLLGMTLAVSFDSAGVSAHKRDVFDLAPEGQVDGPRSANEWVTLLALDPIGFQTLLCLQERASQRVDRSVPLEALAESAAGLHLVLGPPGSILDRIVSGRRPWRSALYLEPLLSVFPRSQTSFGGLYTGPDESDFALRIGRLEKLPGKIAPLAVHWVAYRQDRDRFWGLAKTPLSSPAPPYEITSPLTLEHPQGIEVALQGLSGALSRIAKWTQTEVDLSRHYHSTPPIYPAPRGTDTHSFFWTLGQEIAISTGHINQLGYKSRLYEEFQFFKQTDWPTVFLLLWDLRRRVGFSPGTLRLSEDWIATSLFAHILGLSRVDPIRSNLPFQPRPLAFPSEGSLTLEIEGPHGWEKRLLTAAEQVLGVSKTLLLKNPPPPNTSELLRSGNRLLSQWEEREFAGNRPESPPPLLHHLEDPGSGGDDSLILHLSGRAIGFLSNEEDEGSRECDFDPHDRDLLGGLNLVLHPKALLTLASASRYRGISERVSRAEPAHESVTDWIERHEGQVFSGKPYADDSGHFEVLSWSPSLTRLLTLPESTGYRPLLWKWLVESPPRDLNDLASFLALAYHWTFWSNRPYYRNLAERAPFTKEKGSPPPWWESWELFLKQFNLDSRIAARLSSQLEKETLSTGGWILYRESLEAALAVSLEWSATRVRDFLAVEDTEDSWESEEEYAPFSPGSRRGFLDFIGHPNPLPQRHQFLKKAEEILSASDAFVADPAAWAALSSFLYPQEIEERRTVYRLLKDKGLQIRPPRHREGIPFARSPQPGQLTLGLTDFYGVGPQIAAELSQGNRYRSPHDLFVSVAIREETLNFPAWLRKMDPSLHLSLLETLIHLGFFDSHCSDRKKLLEMARDFHLRRAEKKSPLQQTLFDLGDSSIPHSANRSDSRQESAERKPIEWELSGLRIPLSATPFENYRDRIPSRWIEGSGGSSPLKGIVAGWAYDFEIFSRHPQSPLEPSIEESGLTSVDFLCHTADGPTRMEDPEGLTLPLLPEEVITRIRPDGYRLQLRDPLCLILGTVPKTAKTSSEIATFRIIAAESVEQLLERQESWAKIQVRVPAPQTALLEELGKCVDWFAWDQPEFSTLIELTTPGSMNPLTFIKRRMKTFPARSVVASEVLVARIRQTPGVTQVEIIPRQAPLFKNEKEG